MYSRPGLAGGTKAVHTKAKAMKMPPRVVVSLAPILESRIPPKKCPTTVKVPIMVAALATASASQFL